MPFVRLAPLTVPLPRRLQTLVVALTASIFFLCISLLIFCLLNPFTYPLLIPYFLWIATDSAPETGGRRSEWLRQRRIWGWMRDYFPVSLVCEHELVADKKYVMGYHPHGIISTGLWINFLTEANEISEKLPGITVFPLTLRANLRIPFWRDFILASGVCSVTKQSCDYLLRHGEPGTAIMVVPGGAREALDAHPGTNDLTLRCRRGFVRVALEHGASLVPVFSFGENDIFKQVDNRPGTWVRRWQHWFMQYAGFAPCMPYGRGMFNYDFGLLPQRHSIVTVIGAPIDPPLSLQRSSNGSAVQVGGVSEELVTEYHQRYMDALVQLYDKYKDRYAKDRQRDLKIIR